MDTNLITAIAAAVAASSGSKNDSTLTVILIAMIAAIPPTLVAMAGLFKSKEAVAGVKEVVSGVREVHLSINSRLDKWLIAEHNQGIAAGRQQVIGETADAAAAAVVLAKKSGVPAAAPIPLIPAAVTLTDPQVSHIVAELMQALESKRTKGE